MTGSIERETRGPLLTLKVHEQFQKALRAGATELTCSLDLDRTTTTVALAESGWTWQEQRYPYLEKCKERTVYYWREGEFAPVSRYSSSLIKLVPTEWGTPTFEIDGIKMLVSEKVSPYQDAQAKVALIEREKMGGDCLNTGCVPSKALIRTTRLLADAARAEEFGLTRMEAQFDFATVMDRVRKVVAQVEPHDSEARYAGLGVDVLRGDARIVDPWRVQVGGRTLTTRAIVVASGAAPLVPNIPGIDGAAYVTSETIWDLRELPRRLLVLGGGPIGCELAQCFRRLGSEVTIVDLAPRLLTKEDEDAASVVAAKFRDEGIRLVLGDKAARFEGDVLVTESGARIEFDRVLLALGRKPRTAGFGLEELGVQLTSHGTIEHDETLRSTTVPTIHVAGDVAGPFQFTHTAGHQGFYAAFNALFGALLRLKADYRVIPWATFTEPEVARVGLSEAEAKQRGVAVEVVRYGIDDLDRAIADGDAYGFVKLLVKPGTDRILGATVVGPHAGDLLHEFVLAMKHGIGLKKILGTVHAYPTLAEATKYAASAWRKAHVAGWQLQAAARYHRWRRG